MTIKETTEQIKNLKTLATKFFNDTTHIFYIEKDIKRLQESLNILVLQYNINQQMKQFSY